MFFNYKNFNFIFKIKNTMLPKSKKPKMPNTITRANLALYSLPMSLSINYSYSSIFMSSSFSYSA